MPASYLGSTDYITTMVAAAANEAIVGTGNAVVVTPGNSSLIYPGTWLYRLIITSNGSLPEPSVGSPAWKARMGELENGYVPPPQGDFIDISDSAPRFAYYLTWDPGVTQITWQFTLYPDSLGTTQNLFVTGGSVTQSFRNNGLLRISIADNGGTTLTGGIVDLAASVVPLVERTYIGSIDLDVNKFYMFQDGVKTDELDLVDTGVALSNSLKPGWFALGNNAFSGRSKDMSVWLGSTADGDTSGLQLLADGFITGPNAVAETSPWYVPPP